MKVNEISVKGFKSIGDLERIALSDVTVLLGSNGSGKSNVISLFRLLGDLTSGALQQYVGKQGVSQLLFYGPKVTESLSLNVVLEDDGATDTYDIELAYGLPDRLFVSRERVSHQKSGRSKPQEYLLANGGSEAGIGQDERPASKTLAGLLRGIQAFQFHDTSDTARIKDRIYVDDVSFLRSDGGNLAAFLKMLKESDDYLPYYERIVRHIRKIMPQFKDFVLDALPGNERFVRLNWSDTFRPDYLFGPDQISDGSLRFMALTTLLLQPPALLPKVIVLDEPELGLHPAATLELAGMIKRATQKTQVVLATQSTRLVDEFLPEQIVIVERNAKTGASSFHRLKPEVLGEWLQRYSLSELWEKNVLGGQP